MSGPSRYPRIFERLYGRPLLLLPDKAFTIERVFQQHLLSMSTEAVVREAYRDSGAAPAAAKPYDMTAGGVAVLQIVGTMVQRSSFMDAMSGITSYAEIGFNFAVAEADPDVKGILLEIDSGGGEVNGCFDLVDQITGSTKPVWCVANEAAYSAAYAIASAADRIYMPRTAGVGSIGVIALHVDESERDKKQGYSYTPIFAGDHKYDANSHEPLPGDVRAAIQADVDRLYKLFVETVADNRSMTTAQVIATQADVFHTAAAIDLGLADDAGTLDDAINQFEDFLVDPSVAASRAPGRTSPMNFATAAAAAKPGVDMTQQTTAAQPASITPEALEAARTQAAAEATQRATVAASAAERSRVATILASEEAKGRNELATHLATETDMAADAAIRLLAKSPKDAPIQAATNAFAAAMDATKNPNVTADGTDGGTADIDDATKAAIRIASAGGRKLPNAA